MAKNEAGPDEQDDFETGMTMPGETQSPPAWPGDLEPGSRLAGVISYADQRGGQGQHGTIDIDVDEDTRFRFYVNRPAERILNEAMRKASILSWDELKGKTIRLIFASWEKSRNGRRYRTFGIGLSK